MLTPHEEEIVYAIRLDKMYKGKLLSSHTIKAATSAFTPKEIEELKALTSFEALMERIGQIKARRTAT